MLSTLIALAALQQPTSSPYLQDFDFLAREVSNHYAYLDRPGVDWEGAASRLRPRAAAAATPGDFLDVLEELLEGLRDHHVHLNVNGDHSPRLVPSQTDLWCEWVDGEARITAVRVGSDAERAEIRPGMRVETIRGEPASAVAARRLGLEGAAELAEIPSDVVGWALRVEVAGRWNQPRRFGVAGALGAREVALGDGWAPGFDSAVEWDQHYDGRIGVIRLNNSLGDFETVAAFGAALDSLMECKHLVIDLRETPGGGDSTVARGILGRFVERRQPYQRHVLVGEERATGIQRSWLEEVSPLGERYTGEVTVLVGRWTGSMGEGLAMGFNAVGAQVLGDPMAGLLGALTEVELESVGWTARFAHEALTHVDGTPREVWLPSGWIDQRIDTGEADPALELLLQMIDVQQRVVIRCP
ncbi:MAG: S41 family peptidase [Planctomycetota bacterium]